MKTISKSWKMFLFLLSLVVIVWGCGGSPSSSNSGDSNSKGKVDDGNSTTQDAPKTEFTCTTQTPEDGQTATIKFTVMNLVGTPNAKGEVELVWPGNEDESPITVEPESSSAIPLTTGIVDGFISYADSKLTIFSDDIGCDFGYLVLYEDNKFQYGYFRLEQHCSEDNSGFYTKVSCQLNPPIR